MPIEAVPFSAILQFATVLLIVIVWIIVTPWLKSPWIPNSNFWHMAVLGFVFLFFWDKFISHTMLSDEPLYVWYGLLLVIGLFMYWARISMQEPTKRSG